MLVAPALLLCKGSEDLSLDFNRLVRYGVLLHRNVKGGEKAQYDANNSVYLGVFLTGGPEKDVRCGRRTCTKERHITSDGKNSVLTERCKILMYNRHKPRTNTTQPTNLRKSRPPHFRRGT